MNFLNPYAKVKKAEYAKQQKEATDKHEERRKARSALKKEHRKKGRQFITKYYKELEGANAKTIKEYKNYIKSTKVGKEALKDLDKDEE